MINEEGEVVAAPAGDMGAGTSAADLGPAPDKLFGSPKINRRNPDIKNPEDSKKDKLIKKIKRFRDFIQELKV